MKLTGKKDPDPEPKPEPAPVCPCGFYQTDGCGHIGGCRTCECSS